MSIDPNNLSGDSSGLSAAGTAQRQAVWPWLLLPLVALALFFALRSVKQAPHRAAHSPESTESIASEASESP
jgi:hypothetical protein